MPKALVGLVEKMPKRRAPMVEEEPEIEGEPEDGAVGAGEEEDGEEMEGPPSSERPGGYGEHVELALDDLADVVGVAPEDRQDFGVAMRALVHAVVAEALEGGPKEREEEEELEEEEEGEPGEE